MTALRARMLSARSRPASNVPRALFVLLITLCSLAACAGMAFAAPVTTPVVSPVAPDGASGWYVTTPTVTLSASEPGVSYYSLETSGGPWTPYFAPVAVPEGVTTLYYYSEDTSGNVEPVASLQLRVDTAPPLASVGGITDGGLYAAAVTPTFSATDDNLDAATAALDGDPFTSGSLVASEGVHTLLVDASDAAGNEASATATFTIDMTAPAISVSGVTDGGLYSGAVTPTFSAVDARLTTTTATLDGAPFDSGTAISADGDHTLVVTASDAAGNTAASTVAFTVDTTPPTVGVTTVPSSPDGLAGWYTTTPQVTFAASEPSTIAYSLVSTAGPFTDYDAPLDISDGSSTLYYRATDSAGNTSEVASLAVDVDTAAPEAPGGVGAGATGPTSLQLSWDTVTDDGSGLAYYRVYQDGSAVSTTTDTFYAATGLASQTEYSFEVEAVDAAGNTSAKSDSASASTLSPPDTAPPVTTPVVSPVAPDGASGWYVTTPTVTLSASEPGVSYYSLETSGGPWTPYSTPVAVPEGVTTLYYYSEDTSGNVEPVASLQLRVDTAPPLASVGGITDGGLYAAAVTPTFSATDDNLDAATAALDGDPFTSGSLVASEGVHTLLVDASDAAGNEASATATFTIDMTAPAISVSGVTDGGLYAGAVTPTFSAVDARLTTTTATLDGAPFDSGTAISADGDHTLVVTASDAAGNTAASTVAFTVDTTPPTVGVTTVPSSPDGLAGWYTTTPQVTFAASEPSTIAYSLVSTAGPFTDYDAPLDISDGSSTLYYRATDSAGNTSEVASLAVDVDTAAPEAPGGVGATSGSYTSALVTWDAITDDGSGLAYYRVYQDDSAVSTTTATGYNASALATGTAYSYRISAVDTAGNESTRSAAATVTTSADFTSPLTTVIMSPASPDGSHGWYVSLPTAMLLADEPGITYYSVETSTGPWSVYSTLIPFPQGSSTLYYYSQDSLGNTETVRSQAVGVDLTPPSTPVATATAESTRTILVSWEPASDAGSGVDEYRVIDATTSEVLTSVPGTTTQVEIGGLAPSTTYSYRVYAVDAAGALSPASGVVEATTLPPDETPPVTTASLSPANPNGDNGWYTSAPKITLTANEPGRIFWSWDGGTPAQYTGPIDAISGDHSLDYYSIDLAGNTEAANSLHVLVDEKAPTPPSSLEVSVTGPTTMRLDWNPSADADSKVAGYNIHGNKGTIIATVVADVTTYTVTVPQGKLQSFFVRAFDVAGNISKRSNTANKATRASATTSGTAGPTTVDENAPASGRSAFTYSDLRDTDPKYEGGYAQFDNTATAQYTDNPHGGYDTASNKCQVCHAVHRAEGAYYLLRASSEPDACLYCHVNSSHSSMQVYSSDPSGSHTAVGHAMGYSGPIPASATNMSLKTVEVTSTDVDGKTATATVTVRTAGDANRLFRLQRVHSQNPSGDLQSGYSRVGPSAMSCMSCHSVHNAPAETWQPKAFPDNDVKLTSGYKLLRSSPSGSIWGPDDMPYEGTRTVSYTRDGMVGYKAYTDFSTTGLVNKDNVIRVVETTISAGNTGPDQTIWNSAAWPSQPGADPAHSTTGVNQFALSAWCADCHNLAIGSFSARSKGAVSNLDFPQTPTASDSTEATTGASEWTQVKQLDLDLTDVQRLRVVTNLSSVGTGTVDLSLSLGSANATITHSVDSTSNEFTDDINVAGRSGSDTLSLSLKVGTGTTASNSEFDVYAGVDTTTAVKLVADLTQPAHETSMTHSSPFTGADNGPAQCYTCHRGDLTPKPDRPYYTDTKASCELCHYGTGSYATDARRTGGAQSDWPHSASQEGAFLLGAWTVDEDGSVVATTVGTSPQDIEEKVCVRCHIKGKRTHPTVPK